MIQVLLAAGDGHGISPIDFGNPANWKASLWALGIFIVLLFILKKVAWGPIVQGLADREERISASLKKAEEIEKATAELAARNEKLLGEAQQKAQEIIAEARESASIAAAEMKTKAEEEITAARERAKREVALEAEKARSAVRGDAVDLTVAAVAKMLGREMTGSDHRRLAMDALRDAEDVARN